MRQAGGRRRGARSFLIDSESPVTSGGLSLGFATTRSGSVVARGAASNGGCSQDWLPHVIYRSRHAFIYFPVLGFDSFQWGAAGSSPIIIMASAIARSTFARLG